MRTEMWIFAILTVYLLIVAPIYWLMSHDPTGTTALALTFALCLMISGYLFILQARLPKRPEDRKDGEIVEGAGELGFFPPSSIWPLYLALTAVPAVLAPVFGWWLLLVAIGVGCITLTGWVYQYYRGEHAH